MTEEEAKTKWCPMVKTRVTVLVTDGHPEGRIRGEVVDKEDKCIGSACMMWRWEQKPEQRGDFVFNAQSINGYCGLAGKP